MARKSLSTGKKVVKKSANHKALPHHKAKRAKAEKSEAPGKNRTPRSHKPDTLSLEQWQIALRREFGTEQKFKIKNIGSEPIFSEFQVTNPETGGVYRVAIRGEHPGNNYCSCPDYAVNTLGTCKHIEWTLSKLRRKRGGKAALAAGFQPAYSEVYLRYGLQREVVFSPGILCPEKLKDLARQWFNENGILKAEAYAHFDEFLKEATRGCRNGHELHCYEDTLAFIAQIRDDMHRRMKIQKKFRGGITSSGFEKLLKIPLYPYQRQGALFAASAGRCLIADDMGLGKTIQAIAAAEILACTANIERGLIICPTSLKHQWRDEIAKCSKRAATVVEGSIADRTACFRDDSFFKIINYDVIHRDQDLIREWQPDLIILDEAQRIKNWKTRTAQCVKKLPAEHVIVLTGTPLENRLEEVHSIVEFVDRHRMGPLFRFLAEHQHVDEAGKVVGYRNLSKIAETLEPILVRRTKQEVLGDLPERLDKTFFVPMTPEQMAYHEENRESVARIVAKWRRYRFISDVDQRRLMIALQNMRMACNSTYLLDQKTDFGVKADEMATLLEETFEQPAVKVVVFSQWLRTHELLARRIEIRGWSKVLFHGGVPGPKRNDLIRHFKEDPECRLFLATDAGSVGLNLQHASMVINMDQPWNPAVIEQRIGRVHRLGQHRPVRVVNYVAQGTIEHGMLSLLDFKKSVFAGVLDGGENEVFLGGTRLKRFMESVERATENVPDPMPSTDRQDAAMDAVEAANAAMEKSVPMYSSRDANQAAWSELASAGIAFLEKLGQALNTQDQSDTKPGTTTPKTVVDNLPASLLERDEHTSRHYLKLPVPEPQVLQNLADLLGKLIGAGKQG